MPACPSKRSGEPAIARPEFRAEVLRACVIDGVEDPRLAILARYPEGARRPCQIVQVSNFEPAKPVERTGDGLAVSDPATFKPVEAIRVLLPENRWSKQPASAGCKQARRRV